MPVNIQVYSNANSSSKTVSFNFVGEVLAANYPIVDSNPANVASTEYYFKVTAGATQDNNAAYPVKIIRSFDELALSKTGQGDPNRKQSMVNSNVAYSNVKSMVFDYLYDYINGHAADQFSSGCSIQRPMKFR